jgi:hypothetical protein
MATKEYIGARYVPLFADPVDWDKTKTYEPLTIVYHAGNSYTSRQYVPKDIEITDESYWVLTGNYNAQVEQYRKETAAVKAGLEAETETRETADTALSDRITPLEKTMPSKLAVVAHDDTLEGAGINSNKLKVKLNHSTIINGTDNTVYPALAKNKETGAINGIAFNAGAGLTAYNDNDVNVGPGVKLDDATRKILKDTTDAEKSNPIFYGADNTGATVCDDAIQAAIENSGTGITFTDGIYAISRPITTPYNTARPFNVTLTDGAVIVATAKMDAMLKMGVTDKKIGTSHEGFKITGGHFNANHLADTAIYTSGNLRQNIITNVDIKYFLKTGITIDTSTTLPSTDTFISNVRINRVQTPKLHENTIGVNFLGPDNIITDCYICDTQTGVKCAGMLQASNIHFFVDVNWKNYDTTAIYSNEGVFSNIYIDSYKYGIDTTGTTQVNGLFNYNYFENEGRYIFKCVDNALHITNMQNKGKRSNIILAQDNTRKRINKSAFTYTCDYLTPNFSANDNDYGDYISGNLTSQTYYLATLPQGNKHQGILLGYLIRQSSIEIGYMNPIISAPRGFEFNFEGPITGDNIFTKTNNQNYGLLLGESKTAPWNPNLTVSPLYIYYRTNRTYNNAVQITFKETHYLGFYAKPSEKLADISTVAIKATSNDNNEL